MAASVYGITHYSQSEGVRQYVRDNPAVAEGIYENVSREAFDGAKKGALLGGIAGGLLVYSPLGPTVVTVSLLAKCVFGGAALGSLGGYVVKENAENEYQWTIRVPTSAAFLDWKTEAIVRGFPTVLNDHIGDQNLLDFVCPITLDIIVVPVTDPYGHTYERAAIERSLQERGHRSPLTRGPLNPGQLVANYEYHRNLLPALRDIQHRDVAPLLKEGIDHFCEAVTRIREQELLNLTQQQRDLLAARQITMQQFAENCARITQQLVL